MNEQRKVEADSKGQPIATVELKKIGNSDRRDPSEGSDGATQFECRRQILRHSYTGRWHPLTPYDPDFEEAMNIARRGMKIYRNALAELAK